MKITTTQIQKIHALLPARLKADAVAKANLVVSFTKDATKTSTKQLTFVQANQLIISFGGTPENSNWAFFDAENDQHRHILSLCMQVGWSVWIASKGGYFADLSKLSNFLKGDTSPVKKPLKSMNTQELSKVIYALTKIAS